MSKGTADGKSKALPPEADVTMRKVGRLKRVLRLRTGFEGIGVNARFG